MLLASGPAAVASIALTGGAGSAPPAVAAGFAIPTDKELARSLSGDFQSRHAAANGVRLHHVSGGSGAPLVLLGGWPQKWWQFHKIMLALAKRYRVIAIDLRGMGGSGKPVGGYDKKTMARDVFELIRGLGYNKVDVVGHDIGAMVAYSFAANHPDAVRKLVLLDVHPDESLYQLTLIPRPDDPFFLWWFAFNQVRGLPEQLLDGRMRLLVDWTLDNQMADPRSVGDRAPS